MNKNDRFQYKREYYMSDCDGHIQFKNSRGKVLGKRLKKIYLLASIRAGMHVLDIGCGRGELVLKSAANKAYAWGMDVSTDAVHICWETLKFWKKDVPEIDKYACFINQDATELDFNDSFFDVVFLSDIVEHLENKTLLILLKQVKRVLKKNGKVIIHTAPNKYYLPASGIFFYLIARIISQPDSARLSGKKRPSLNLREDLPSGLQKNVHLNEQSGLSLRRTLKKSGLKAEKIWLELNPHYIDRFFTDKRAFHIINFLKKVIPVKHFFYADLYCIASA
jgi:2-polyprenyl-3-methyl-5-hydroxy-6-metoxy-1,4-benzoquinol methylase